MSPSRRRTTRTEVAGVASRGDGRPVRGLLVLLVTLVGVISWPVEAQAHTELVASSPAGGSQVALSTDSLRLEFAEELLPVGHDVVVLNADGDDVTLGDPATSGSILDVQLDLTAPGRHTVSYRVVGQDGHAITGELWFTAAAERRPLSTAVAAPQGGTSRATAAVVAREVPSRSSEGSTSAMWLLPSVGLAGVLVLLHRASRGGRPARARLRDGR